MAKTIVRDYVVWAKHISDDPRLTDRILKMNEKETIALVVDNVPGIWEKMANDGQGRPTSGLKPVGAMKKVWSSLYRDRRGSVVSINWADPEPHLASGGTSQSSFEPPLARNEAERQAAWKAFLSLAGKGWRSEGPYGPREELYDR